MKIVVDDLSGPEIAEFLDAHVRQMRTITPPDDAYALDLDACADQRSPSGRSGTTTRWSAAARSNGSTPLRAVRRLPAQRTTSSRRGP